MRDKKETAIKRLGLIVNPIAGLEAFVGFAAELA
jgi:hypothetical protein